MSEHTQEEFEKGVCPKMEEVLNLPLARKMWFNSIEAAQGRVPMTHNGEREEEEDTRKTDCEPVLEATGWIQAACQAKLHETINGFTQN